MTEVVTVVNAGNEPKSEAEVLIRNQLDYEPKVSVIIPVYNVAKYLRQCLDSVLGQTLKEIEIICVDDGSTDGSGRILEEYAAKDERVVVCCQKNQGSAAARNYGINRAQGEYIGFVDADDYVCETYFDELYNAAYRNDADIAATSQVVRFTAKKQFFKNTGISSRAMLLNSIEDKASIIVTTGVSWNKIYKKSFLDANDIKYCEIKNPAEDNYFTDVAVIAANKIAITHWAVYYYRMLQSSQTQVLKTNKDFATFDVYRQIEDKIQMLSISENEKNKWENVINARKVRDAEEFLSTMADEYKVSFQELIKQNTSEIIISLTSYPARIDTVNQTIETLLKQSVKADKVILWLAPEQFPNKEADLPRQLLDLSQQGLIIDWYHDIKSYKKLLPTLKKYPEAIIVTADDDILYPKNWLELLLKSYYKNPTSIHCHRAHRFGYKAGAVVPYNQWKKHIRMSSLSYANFVTTGGGVLYPPHCLHEDVLKEDVFTELCPRADDIWFWTMAVLNNTRIQIVKDCIPDLVYVPGTQEAETCLWRTNTGALAQNDIQMQKVLEAYPEVLPKVVDDLDNEPDFTEPSTRKYYLFGVPLIKITES